MIFWLAVSGIDVPQFNDKQYTLDLDWILKWFMVTLGVTVALTTS